jgi:murein DD-endopeptidase MepM/ murein hydrolase activator NlpD
MAEISEAEAGGKGGVGAAAAGGSILRKMGGAGLALGTLGAYKAYKYYQGFNEKIPLYNKMVGMGFPLQKELYPTLSTGAPYGMNMEQSHEMMMQILSSTGKFDKRLFEGAGRFSRTTGVTSELSGQITPLLAKGGGLSGDILVKKQAEVFASAYAAKLERGRIGEYLQTTASTMEELMTRTPGVSGGAYAELAGLLSRGTGGQPGVLGPGQSANIMKMLDESVRNPQGPQGIIASTAVANVLSKGGYKGAMPFGIMSMMQQGLFAPKSIEELEQQAPTAAKMGMLGPIKQLYEAYRKGGGARGVVKGMVSQYEQWGQGTSGLGTLLFAQKYGQSPQAAAEFMARVKRPEFTEEDAADWLEEMSKDQAKMIPSINDTATGMAEMVSILKDIQSDILGKQLVPLAIEGNKVLTDIYNVINQAQDETMGGVGMRGTRSGARMQQLWSTLPGSDAMPSRSVKGSEVNFLGMGDYRLTSPMGRRNTGIPGASTNHPGIDLAMPFGTPVSSRTGGTVTSTGASSFTVQTPVGFLTARELSKVRANKGQTVGPSEVLGETGVMSGGVGGHFETRDLNGNLIDPLLYSYQEAMYLQTGAPMSFEIPKGAIMPNQINTMADQ